MPPSSKHRAALCILTVLAAGAPAAAQESSRTTAGIGLDYVEGDYGTRQTTTTLALPVSIKHESGRWTFKASIPYVWTEGTFSRETGAGVSGSGKPEDNPAAFATEKQRQSGLGDLTLGVFRNVHESKAGGLIDVGVKAKLATADKANTLISSGENDYSLQVDAFAPATRAVSIFGTLGITRKGDTASIDYRDPLYGTLGASLSLGEGRTLGAAWDFREKTTAAGNPVSELMGFYSFRLGAERKLQFYLVAGLSDGSPDEGAGVVLTQRF